MKYLSVQWRCLVFLGLAAVAGPGTATAGLIGATVDVGAYYPTSSSLFVDGGNQVVSSSIEYPSGSFAPFNGDVQIDVTDTQLILTCDSVCFPFGSADFNGYILKVVSGPAILSATVDGSSDFSPVGLSVVNGNEIDLNFEGVKAPKSGVVSSIIDIDSAFPTPEPATFLLMGIGGLALASVRRAHSQLASGMERDATDDHPPNNSYSSANPDSFSAFQPPSSEIAFL
jgi:hypothetical protein